jgi:flagellin-like hook-associated protein FlgL
VPNQQAQVYSYRLSQSDIDTINSAATSAIDGDPIFISNLGQQTGYSISVSGSNNSGVVSIALQHSTSNDLFVALDASDSLPQNSPYLPTVHRGDVAPLMGTYPYAPYGSQDTLKAIDSVLNSFTSKLAKVGAYINRLESSVNAITDNQSNKMASKARIEDTDYAKATLDLTKSKIMKEASMLMLKTGQDYKNLVLNLIR